MNSVICRVCVLVGGDFPPRKCFSHLFRGISGFPRSAPFHKSLILLPECSRRWRRGERDRLSRGTWTTRPPLSSSPPQSSFLSPLPLLILSPLILSFSSFLLPSNPLILLLLPPSLRICSAMSSAARSSSVHSSCTTTKEPLRSSPLAGRVLRVTRSRVAPQHLHKHQPLSSGHIILYFRRFMQSDVRGPCLHAAAKPIRSEVLKCWKTLKKKRKFDFHQLC